MSATPILNQELNFSRGNYWEYSGYFESGFLVLFARSSNTAYRYNLGKCLVIPFLPGFGDTQYRYQEISEGFNLIEAPSFVKQWKIAIQPFAKVEKLQIKLFTTDYKTTYQPVSDWLPGYVEDDELDGGDF